MTVPSCAEHNNDKSKDVECARNAITTLWGINTAGLALFGGKVVRSLHRRPRLLTQTFSTMQTVFYEGQMTGAFTLDTSRLENVFGACARAIHYHDRGTKHSDWGIVMPRLMFGADAQTAEKERWGQLCEFLQGLSFEKKTTANPQIFEYGTAELETHALYCFVFYQSFVVYTLPIPEGLRHELTTAALKLGAKG